MNELIAATVEATPSVIERVGHALPADFPAHVFHAVTSGLARAAQTLSTDAD